MDCKVIEPELVAYHFGVVDEPLRDRIEQHMLGCPACLAAFLRLKRAVETAPAADGLHPSETARARLRQAADVELSRLAAQAARPSRWPFWSWRGRLAVAGLGLAAVLLIVRIFHAGPASPRGPLEDLARPGEASARVL
jgi:hypothetical protein